MGANLWPTRFRETNRRADEAAVIDRALTVLVEQLEKVKYGRTGHPRPAGPPRAESRGPSAPGCIETAGLQYHHRIPFADGGPTTADNLELRCPAHNAYEAEQWFGPLFVRETYRAWGAWSGPNSSA